VISCGSGHRIRDEVLVVALPATGCWPAGQRSSPARRCRYLITVGAVKVRQGSYITMLPGNVNPKQMKAMMKKSA
jgi:hypothetical protein